MPIGVSERREQVSDDPHNILIERYVRVWSGSVYRIIVWEKLRHSSRSQTSAEVLADWLFERSRSLALFVARDFGQYQIQRTPNRISPAHVGHLLDMKPPRPFPLALLMHSLMLEAAFEILGNMPRVRSERSSDLVALRVLITGMRTIGRWIPPRQRHEQSPGGSSLRWREIIVDGSAAVAADEAVRSTLPPQLVATLLGPAASIIPFLLAEADFRMEPTSGHATLGGHPWRGMTTIVPERQTFIQREVLGQLLDFGSRRKLASETGRSLILIDKLLRDARSNAIPADRDIVIWAAADLSTRLWLNVEHLLATDTTRAGNLSPNGRTSTLAEGSNTSVRGRTPILNRTIVAAIIIVCRTGLSWHGFARQFPRLAPCTMRTAETRLRVWLDARSWSSVQQSLSHWFSARHIAVDWSRIDSATLGSAAEVRNEQEIARVAGFEHILTTPAVTDDRIG